MAEDEDIDIDIDIDIDGDDPEDELMVDRINTPAGSGLLNNNNNNSNSSSNINQNISNNGDSVQTGSVAMVNGRRSSTASQSGQNGAKSESARTGMRNENAESSLADEFQIPDWIVQDYEIQAGFHGGDMDEKSRQMIANMLAEEEFYSGRGSKDHSVFYGQTSSSSAKHDTQTASRDIGATAVSSATAAAASTQSVSKGARKGMTGKGKNHDSKKRKSSEERSGQTKRTASEDSRLNAKLSSADLPSHNTRWTAEEDSRLREGIRLHGYGNWKAIAAVVETRNALQVKNHARHLAVSDKIPHDISTNTSDGEGLDRRSSAANSEDEKGDRKNRKKRQSRSKHVKRIVASAGEKINFESYGRYGRRARSVTSESGNDDFTGSEFGATSGYDTDNDEDRSVSKSPSLSAKGSRAGSIGLGTPSPALRPIYSSLPSSYPLSTQRTAASSMDEDEDIDIDIETTDEESSSRLTLVRSLPTFTQKSKSRSISPFSNSSTRSRLSSEFDSTSDRDLDGDDDNHEIMESGSVRKRTVASSPALSDNLGSSSDLYTTPNFNTSSSSVNSVGVSSSFKPLLKDTHSLQQQQHQHYQKSSTLHHISIDKISSLPKERRTVSFGAVHVAELKSDLNSYDENSSEDGGGDVIGAKAGLVISPSPLSNPSYVHGIPSVKSQTGRPQPLVLQASGVSSAHNRHSISSHSVSNGSNKEYYSKDLGRSQESGDSEVDEGYLGSGTSKVINTGVITQVSHKIQRAGSSKSKSFAGDSSPATFQYTPTMIALGQTSIAPGLTIATLTTTTTTASTVTPRILDKSIITEEEKLVHSEFFCNKASKTPERYQRIRNTILQFWERSPSTYLTKTSVRSGLKDCGDVNAIGRVHSWLESIGAINVGMTASSPGASLARPRNGGNNSLKKRAHSEERGWSSSSSSSAPRRANYQMFKELGDMDTAWPPTTIRRRRVRNEKGEWVDERELEGRVIEHYIHDGRNGKHVSRSSSRKDDLNDDLLHLDDAAFFERHGMTKEEMEEELEQERLAAQNAKYFAATELLPVNTRVPKNRRAQHLLRQTRGFHEYEDEETTSGGYDPFRLVTLRKYNQQHPAPFKVKVSSDAMLIMDFHSHLAETEVIGLLGGLYDEDEKILFILGVFPCRSISTGLQCEMDPESDVEARYFFSSKGFVVVGWYHSHPTFEPNPSIRDIENQSEHQAMFRRRELGVEPFVGVIVSPFDPRNLSFLSKFQFLSVSEEFDEGLNCRLPYGYDRVITRTNELSVSVFQQLSDLVRYYRTYEHRVDLSLPLKKGDPTITRLDKLLKSLNHHIFVDENAAKAFLSKVRELVVRGFQLNMDRVLQATTATGSQVSTTSSSSLSLPSSAPSSLPESTPLSSLPTSAPSSQQQKPENPLTFPTVIHEPVASVEDMAGSTPFKGPFTTTVEDIEIEMDASSGHPSLNEFNETT
ncbi:Myb-like, SWIRM and MPN domains 1 [Haplosporangium sp. Z 767]|nr:Myb-like, SWIRM and MPN domains 1 [Haplosporangium sp. Z 767]